jgi:ferredoxin
MSNIWVFITILDPKGKKVGIFKAEDNKSFTKMAKEHEIMIISSCGVWACWMCKCKIISWYKFIQVDKMWKPRWELLKDSNWNVSIIFTCLAGVKSKYLSDGKFYEIILQRNI